MPEPVERGEEWLIEQVAAALAGEISDLKVRRFFAVEDHEEVEPWMRERVARQKARLAVSAIIDGLTRGVWTREGLSIDNFARFGYVHTGLNRAAGKPSGTLCPAGITLGPLKPNWLTEKREEAVEAAGCYAGEMLGPVIDPGGWDTFSGYIGGVYYQSPSIGPYNENSENGWFVVKKTVSVNYRSAVGADAWGEWARVDSVRGVLVWGHVEYVAGSNGRLVVGGVAPGRSQIFGHGLGFQNFYLFADKWAEFDALKMSAAQAWANPLQAGFPAAEMLKCFPRKMAWARRMPPDGWLRSEPVQWLTFGQFMDYWESWRDADLEEGRVWPKWPGDREVTAWRVRVTFAPSFVAEIEAAGE